jgi:STAND-like protein
MDPLSITSSGIAVLAAVIASCKSAHQVVSGLRDAPKELQKLSQESMELQAVLADITSANQLKPSAKAVLPESVTPSPAFSAALSDHIQKAEEILTSLKDLVTSLGPSPSSNDAKVKRLGWLKNRKRVMELRKDMNKLKVSLGALLTSRAL